MNQEDREMMDILGLAPNNSTETPPVREDTTPPPIVDRTQKEAIVRFLIIGGITGAIALFILGTFRGIAGIGSMVAQNQEEEAQIDRVEIELSQRDKTIEKLKGKLATESQANDLEELNRIKLTADNLDDSPPEPKIEPAPPVKKIAAPPAPKSQPVAVSRPLTRPTPPKPQPKPTSKPTSKPTPNPEALWSQLSNFGMGVAVNPEATLVANNSPAINPLTSADRTEILRENFDSSTGEFAQRRNTKSLTPGARGILARSPLPEPKEVQTIILPPNSIKAKVNLPLVWNTQAESNQQYNRFTMEIREPIEDGFGNTVIPKGAIATAEVDRVYAGGFVNATVIAITYEDEEGNLRQQDFSSGEVIVRNEKQEAVMAKKSGGEKSTNRLLSGAVSTMANLGGILTEPNNNTTISNNNGSVITTTTSNNETTSKRVVGAVVEGFFDNLKDQITYQSEIAQRRNIEDGSIFILENGYEVKLIFLQSTVIEK